MCLFLEYLLFFFQAVESYAWNIRVLKGQAELLLNAKGECQEYLRQVASLNSFYAFVV